MSRGRVLEGVLAINKPPHISSAQVLRDLQTHFNPSALFAPWLAAESSRRAAENRHQQRRRRDKRRAQVKIGHGGTLDPLATGVLIAGIGRGTKQLQGFLECTKSYETTMLFGVATDTYDRLGKVLSRAGTEHITRGAVEQALGGFRGKIMQRPPLFSALRVQGKRLYEYAREGKEVPVEIQERPVEVLELELVDWLEPGSHPHRWPSAEAPSEEKMVAEKVLHIGPHPSSKPAENTTEEAAHPPAKRTLDEADTPTSQGQPSKRARRDSEVFMSGGLLPESSPPEPSSAAEDATASQVADADNGAQAPAARLRMTVTSGFYVRSLCHDLGAAVGSLGLMSELVRTRQADFELGKNVLEYGQLAEGEEVWGAQVERMLDEWDQRPQGNVADKARNPRQVDGEQS